MDPRYDGIQPSSQSVMQDDLDGMHTSRGSYAPNTSEVKPVLNYSIQTGEEFALEFMRDRVNFRKPVISNVGDPNSTTGHISHAGCESGSDISMHEMVGRDPKGYDGKDALLHGGRCNYGSIQSMPRASCNRENGRILHGHASCGSSDSSSMTMKVLCSFGGRILPRPGDGKLRYVGGETRIIRIRKDIFWQELMQKSLLIYNQTHVIKYQLPGEDLDALVSVSSDEDLQNMMEECNHPQGREGSQKLRIFLFSMNDLDDAQFGLSSVGDDSEVQFVVAVNGMDFGSRNNSILLGASSSANDVQELVRQNTEREVKKVPVESMGASNGPLIGNYDSPSTIQPSESIPPTSSNAHETYPPYRDQMMHLGEAFSQYPIHHGLNPSQNFTLVETSNAMLSHGMINQQGNLNEGSSPNVLQVLNSEIPAMLVKKLGDSSVPQGSNSAKVLSSETPSHVPMQPKDDFLRSNVNKATVAVNMPEWNLPTLLSMKKEQHQEHKEAPSTSGSAFGAGNVDSQSNGMIDLSCLHPPPMPKRVYYSYSERTPREQVELLNRSAKSDDTYDSQFPVSILLSDINSQYSVTESGDNLPDGNQYNLTEDSSATPKPLYVDGNVIVNGLNELQMHKLLPEMSSHMKSKLSELVDVELKQVLPNNEGSKVMVNEDQVIMSETDSYFEDNHSKPLVEENKNSKSDFPALDQVPNFKNNDGLTSHLPGINWGHSSGKELNNDSVVQELPVSLTGNMSEDISQGFSSNALPKQAQADILIDIDDRFPRELLSDMYTKAVLAEDPSSLHPLSSIGVGISINMENHEPKSWSYFGKLAQELDNSSLIDQDPLGFSPESGNVGGDKTHLVTPLTADEASIDHADLHLNFDGESQKGFHGMIGTEPTFLRSNYDHSHVKETESMQFDATVNSRAQESDYEDGKFETRNSDLPSLDRSLGGFDISTLHLQVINNEDLEELKELGSGTFGTVYHGKWRGTDVAIKRIKKICFTGRSSEQERLTVEFWREADILSKLHHPNVLAFYGVVQDGPGGTMATVTEYMVDGSLRHVLLRKDRYLDRRKRLIIAMDAAFGMEYLHSKNIVHFDLKCDNLLVNLKDPVRPICKVGDFGLSKIKRNTLVSGGVRGTLPWMAPELLNGSSNKVSEKVDVFSFGIVLWEILTGEEPYANMHYGAIIGGIVNNTLRPTIPSSCDAEWRTLMEQCWAPNPATRPSFTEIACRLRFMSASASQTKSQPHKPTK
ncbi:uncharacterized protein LOC129315409 [Prosopis cineraria]|uniref:uncharacterized protein LOC129315409 n=1 Tax=Prosopis cineraria TaxID=364024 RepID=UPI00240F9B15|nr:uncharacterized protein LOC129315409 [Prosopis cineraria]